MSNVGFDTRAGQAIENATLQAALAKATVRFRTEREHAMREVDAETLRAQGKAIRDDVLAHLDQYLARFSEAATAAGMQVHWAKDAAEANQIALEIAQTHGVKRIAKSKSMVTEEIGLNHALEAAGITVTETDLGEWIVQLAGQPPSHIIAPAVHLTRAQVAELFAKEAGEPVADDIPSLTAFARRALRERFMSADMGISGVNFAIAETGTIAILTNEGNGRFVTGLPRLHVAVMGMEKVVPTWEDLSVLISLLPRSATGQRITSYVSLIAGPRRPGEGDGPDEVHIIILDNGRSGLLGTTYQEALRCIRCGACLNVCPVYHEVGGHTYQATYAGPIGSIITPLLRGLPQHHDLPHASSLCFACRDVCPVKIDLPRLLLELRKEEAEGKQPTAHWAERLGFRLFGWAITKPWIYGLAVGVGVYLQLPLVRDGQLQYAPFPISRWTSKRDFPALDRRPFRKRWRERQEQWRQSR